MPASIREEEEGFRPHEDRLCRASGSCASQSPQNVIVEDGIIHRAPCMIHVVDAEPLLPSTKSIGGPRAFSSMNIVRLFETSVKTHIPRFIITNKKKIMIQKVSIVVSNPINSPHSLVASVSIVPIIANTPIITPKMKNHIPESKTPSKTGKTLEITGRSLSGNSIP